MAWSVEGTYFETCSCDLMCPCNLSFDHGATYDYCRATLVFNIKKGEVDGTDVSGLSVCGILDSPKVMTEGNWRFGLFVDDRASDEQMEKLIGVFSGQVGGPMEALGPLVGEMLGVERVPMTFESQDGRHQVNLGEYGSISIDDVVPFGVETGEPARLTGIFHPAGSELTIGKAGDSRLNVFGLEPALAGQSGFSTAFAWSA